MSARAARLLIVDDEAALLRALCDTLQHAGYFTQGFTSGREAIAALREQSFDLLLTDLTMPETDGIELLRACREIDRDGCRTRRTDRVTDQRRPAATREEQAAPPHGVVLVQAGSPAQRRLARETGFREVARDAAAVLYVHHRA